MAWIRFDVSMFGGGGQGTDSFIEYFNDVGEDGEEKYIDDNVEFHITEVLEPKYFDGFRSPKIVWTRLVGLPGAYWDELRQRYMSQIEHYTKMLEVLKNTRKGKY